MTSRNFVGKCPSFWGIWRLHLRGRNAGSSFIRNLGKDLFTKKTPNLKKKYIKLNINTTHNIHSVIQNLVLFPSPIKKPNKIITIYKTIVWAGQLNRYIATELRAGQSGIESQWERDFPPVQTGPGAHPASCKMGTESFPGVKCGRGVLLTTHPLLVPRSWKSRAIPLPTFWATPGL